MSQEHESVGEAFDHPYVLAGGQRRACERSMDVEDPAIQSPFAVIARANASDVDAVVTAAREAAGDWAAESPSTRGGMINAWVGAIRGELEQLAHVEARDVGKPLSNARRDLFVATAILQYFAGSADKMQGATLPTRSPDRFGYTVREPHGVSAIVLPWNVPAILFASNVGPAIAAGNVVVVKPSELASLTVLRLAELASEAGIPPGVINVVTGDGVEAGSSLVSHPGIDHISFTGSVPTGQTIMHAAAKQVMPLKLELGGKTANVVLADADLDAAIPQIAMSILENSGQNCYAGSRVIAHRSVADDVLTGLKEAFEGVRLGPWHEDPVLGPLISRLQLERVEGFVGRAEASGASVVAGGSDRSGLPEPGYYVRPTLFTAVDPSAEIAQEEVFGPVQVVISADDDDDAIRIANDTRFGLMAVAWTRDLGRAMWATKKLDAGQVTVNEFANSFVIGFPFSTRKQSGFESGSGHSAVHEWTREKSVSIHH